MHYCSVQSYFEENKKRQCSFIKGYLQPRQRSPGILPGIPWVFHVWEHSVASCFSCAVFPCITVQNAVKTARCPAVWTSGVDQRAHVKSPPLPLHGHSAQTIDPCVQLSHSSCQPRPHTHSQPRPGDLRVCCVLYFLQMWIKFDVLFFTYVCNHWQTQIYIKIQYSWIYFSFKNFSSFMNTSECWEKAF